MAYQVLARKWRPQDFASVIGQAPIVTALRNALGEGRIAQAYLFSGIRGVGKTSVARVFAKALNCERGPAVEPCNDCTGCREITGGSDLDVLEIDAATYSKVDQVRELTESLRYGPARARYKIVVIDEIHRLSRQAFDALLKIVEEPPAHLVFLFATTEIEAVPATLLSRCQEFHFRRVPLAELAAHLGQIAAAEEISASDTALRLIARAGEGSVRDSVALLDQMATYASGSISEAEAVKLLGGVDASVHRRILSAMLAGDGAEIVAVVANTEQEGWDPRNLYAQFLAYCRTALHLSLGARVEQTDLPLEDARALDELAQTAGYENLLRILNQLLTSEAVVRRSEAGTLALEVAWLRVTELPKLTRIEALLGQQSAADGSAAEAPPEPENITGPAGKKNSSSSATGARAVAKPADAVDPDRAPHEGAPEEDSSEQRLRSFIEQVSRSKQPLAAHLADAHKLIFADGELLIHTSPDDPWLRNALRRGNNRLVLEDCLTATWGPEARWRLKDGLVPAAEKPPSAPAEPNPALQHPTVQAALEIFGGTAHAEDGEP